MKSPLLKRFASGYRGIAIMVLNTLILLILLEVVAGAILSQRGTTLEQEIEVFKQKQLSLSYYQGQDWAQTYWDEHMQIVDFWDYQPYTVWRTRPADGELMTVNQNRRRVTLGSNCTAETYRIFVFGGSTMWGYGSPDWGTIPAYIQARLNEENSNACVVNLADVAYNSTQEVIQLLLELRSGNVPDMVIFYDGVNDVSSARITGDATQHLYFEQIDEAVGGNLAFGDVNSASSPLLDFIRQTAVVRLIRDSSTPDETTYADVDTALLADEIVQSYLANMQTVEALSDSYGFEFVAVWQPMLLLSERPITDEEQRFLWEMPGGLPELFFAVYPQIEAEAEANSSLVYLADALDEAEGILWIDFNHLTPIGNQVMADAIFELIQPVVAQ